MILLLPIEAKDRVEILKCSRNAASSFAIFTDRTTYDSCGAAIRMYRDVLEEEGLGTYVCIADWKSPEEVKGEILSLYGKKPVLEGVVFIGKVPVVRVEGGQYLTTAFKMNENKYTMRDASVTSDRFYDDFGLRFDYVCRDSIDTDVFYYRLNCKGDQKIICDIYSGRILVPEDMPGDHYAILDDYLARVAEAHREVNPLDHIIFYAGSGYNSDDLNIWREKPLLFREYYPLAFKTASGNRFYDFRQNDNLIRKMFTEIQRPGTDVFVFSEHGDYDTQYVTEPERHETLRDNIAYYYHSDSISNNSRCNILLDDIDSLRSGARLMVFNACYNGSFHRKGYVAGYHIFNGGRCIAAQGNTVNVLQDKWEDQLSGMLSLGLRIGLWQKEFPYLESHIIGDPTFRFTPARTEPARGYGETAPSDLIVPDSSGLDATLSARLLSTGRAAKAKRRVKNGDRAFWYGCIRQSDPRIAALGVREYARLSSGGDSLGTVLRHVLHCSSAVSVRLQALNELYDRADTNIAGVLGYSLMNDPSEEMRRLCARYAGFVGDTSLVMPLLETMLYDAQSKRVAYEAATSIQVFPRAYVDSCIRFLESRKRFVPLEGNSPDDFSGLKDDYDYLEKCVGLAVDRSAQSEKRINAIRTTRNYNLHYEAARFAAVACDASEPVDVRLAMAEALGWYVHSISRKDIVDAFDATLNGKEDMPAVLRAEMEKTVKRLSFK